MYTQMHRNRGSLKNCAGNVRACAVSLSLPRVSSLPHMYEWSVIRSSPVHPPMTTRRGHPYMTSANFFYPLPPCQYHKSVDFVSFVCFWGSPSPQPLRTSYMEALVAYHPVRCYAMPPIQNSKSRLARTHVAGQWPVSEVKARPRPRLAAHDRGPLSLSSGTVQQ